MFINGRKNIGNKKLRNQKVFIDYSQTIGEIYENLEIYNPTKNRRVLIVVHDMMADFVSNKKLSSIVTELLLRGGEYNIFLVFIS